MRSTVTDIARLTGFAPGTVSRALDKTGKYPVSDATRQKVFDAAKQLRYRPNLIGRALVAGSSKLVSFVSLAPFSEYYTSVARHVSNCANKEGYSLVNSASFDPESSQTFGVMTEKLPPQEWLFGVDGIIVCDPGSWQIPVIQQAIEMQIPVVGIGYRPEESADWVKVNLFDATMALLNNLIENGNRRITMISSSETEDEEVRHTAYIEAMRIHGLPISIRFIEQQRRKDGREAALIEIAENGAPNAFFCVNDVVAIGCCRGVREAGLQIPEDVAVAGCDGIEDTEYLNPPLTTLAQPIALMTSKAWDFLSERMNGYDGPPRQIEFDAQLNLRESTDLRR